jgi:hypothetical protein
LVDDYVLCQQAVDNLVFNFGAVVPSLTLA